MEFEVSIDEHAEAYSVVSVRGEVDLHTAPKVRDAIERAGKAAGVVVVDMSGISFMDSTALSTFMRSRDILQEKSVRMPSRVDRFFTPRAYILESFPC